MDPTGEARQRAMGALACMPPALLAERYAALAHRLPAAVPVRGPKVGLVMLRGRAGGGGAAFNLGEASVVRATVKLDTGEVGHAMILGRETDRARMAAHLDAVWQRPDWRLRIEEDFVAPRSRRRPSRPPGAPRRPRRPVSTSSPSCAERD